jgi:hypothetical protein
LFHAILGARLAWDAGCLCWCKSVPIGTVFSSEGHHRTKLVRFSGLLVFLSRLSLLFKGLYQREDGFRRGLGLILGGSGE